MSLYTTGTVTLSNGSKIVNGTGTRFISIGQAEPGHLFTLDGVTIYEILSVNSDTQMQIQTIPDGGPYAGGNLNNVNYAIILNFSTGTTAKLANKLFDIQEKWHQREQDITGWMVSDAATYPVTDVFGDQMPVITPAEITRLASTAETASSDLQEVQEGVAQAQSDLDAITPSINQFNADKAAFDTSLAISRNEIDADVLAAQNYATSASTSAANALSDRTLAQTAANNAHNSATDAQEAVDSFGSTVRTMNFLNFYIDPAGDLVCQYNGIQDSSAFNINASGELEVTI